MAAPVWLFHSVNKSHRIGADEIQHEIRYPDGRIERPSHVIPFDNHLFRTTNKREAKIVRETTDFQYGRIREITEAEAQKLIAVEAQRLQLPGDMVTIGESTLPGDGELGYEKPSEDVSDVTLPTGPVS